jgi:hypothetical protein
LVCGGAFRVASPRLRRAGSDPSKRARRHDRSGAVSCAGELAYRYAISLAAGIDSRESACRDDEFGAAVGFRESAGVE